MSVDLTAGTAAGERLVALAGELAPALAERAPDHDRDGSYPAEGLALLRRAGYLAAPVPTELGGLGVDSVRDLVIAASRLARGDASLAIGVNMHLQVTRGLARTHRHLAASGRDAAAAAMAAILRDVARGEAVISTAVSEPGQDLLRPATRATPAGDGWRIDGRKIFCTMSPAATVLFTAVSFTGPDGDERYGYARIPADAAGVTVHGDWDALGMRASGSHSVSFEGVRIPRRALGGGFAAGRAGGYVARNLGAGLFHASASLGIAEAASAGALGTLRARGGANGDARARMLVAENALDLATCRAVLSRAGELLDAHEAAPAPDEDAVLDVFAEEQAAKTIANEAATRVVDRALALSGGAGYLSAHPLARAYRDVRAGAFMHPLGANRAYDYVGARALGEAPAL